MSEDTTRLPKWAQQRIATLEANVAHYKRKAFEAASADPTDTDTTIETWGDAPLGLPRGTAIRFKLGRARITVRIDGDKLDVRSDGDPLNVRPWACNAVTVKVEA